MEEKTVIKQKVVLSMLHALCALRSPAYPPHVFHFEMFLE
jgi:hypothetical protein